MLTIQLPIAYTGSMDKRREATEEQQRSLGNDNMLAAKPTANFHSDFDPVPVRVAPVQAVPQISLSEILHQTSEPQRLLLSEFSSNYFTIQVPSTVYGQDTRS